MNKAIFLCEDKKIAQRVYDKDVREAFLAEYGADEVYTRADIVKGGFEDVRAIFSTWGMPKFTREEIKKYLPSLQAVFYGAGTVQGFAREFLDCGVRVFSAWQANAVPVAEYTVAQIALAAKGFYRLSRRMKKEGWVSRKELDCFPGNYGAKVGILGDGAVGGAVIRKLKEYKLDIYVYSITMTDADAARSGVKRASLEEIFSECDVISNHLANNSRTVGIIDKKLIGMLKPYSTFINTGRGAQVDEDALIKKLTADDTVTAVLDVTDPEPPVDGSPLYLLENVVLTPHIAGSSGLEVARMGEYMREESRRFFNGEKCAYEVLPAMLETMA